MGCGTGEDIRANECFRIKLAFARSLSSEEDVLYSHFETSVRWALRDRLSEFSPIRSGGRVTGVEITVHGPINTTPRRRKFAQGMNSLTQSVRRTGFGEPSGNRLFVKERQRLPGGQISRVADWEFDTARVRKRRYKKKRAGQARARTGGK
jgi:hypothetical protein